MFHNFFLGKAHNYFFGMLKKKNSAGNLFYFKSEQFRILGNKIHIFFTSEGGCISVTTNDMLASEASYKPEQRSYRKTNLKKKVHAANGPGAEMSGAEMSSAESAAPKRTRPLIVYM